MGDTHESPFRIEVVEDKPTRGMWHCGPNPSWVTVTHLPTMVQARAYHRSQHKAREMALACVEMMLADAGVENETCNFPEALATPAPPTPAEPAPMDREALVRLLQIITRNGSLDDGRTLHEVIADALLARGLRLPGGDETMAWAVLGSDGRPMPDAIYSERKGAHRLKPHPQARIVRVAIRMVEGGDDAA